MLTEEPFEMAEAGGTNVLERLFYDSLERLDPARVHLRDNILLAAPNGDGASTVVVEAQQHPSGNVAHQAPASLLSGKPLVQVFELVAERPIRREERFRVRRQVDADQLMGESEQAVDLPGANDEEM